MSKKSLNMKLLTSFSINLNKLMSDTILDEMNVVKAQDSSVTSAELVADILDPVLWTGLSTVIQTLLISGIKPADIIAMTDSLLYDPAFISSIEKFITAGTKINFDQDRSQPLTIKTQPSSQGSIYGDIAVNTKPDRNMN